MNQERIGKFIAECRKEKGLTQSQLAEQLGVTEKSVGNWENGRNMPDLSLFSPLCNILGISINDLMSGEKVDDKEYINTLEENIVNMVADVEQKKKVKMQIFIIIFGMMILIFFAGNMIYRSYEEDIEYDSRLMKCNIVDNELTFYISGSTVLNTDYISRVIDDKTIYFFHGTIFLYDKKYRDWENIESMKSLLETGKATFGMGQKVELESNNVEVYYTDSSIKKIKKANDGELEKIINESHLMCSSNK